MSEVKVDTEKLTYGLEKGIGYTNTYFSHLPEEKRLRYAVCGLVSSAIEEFLTEQEIPVRQVISTPELPFDHSMQHVMPLVGGESHEVVVDASYSQFLGYIGLTNRFEELINEELFPEEKVIHFNLFERDLMISWLTKVVADFQSRNHQIGDEDKWYFRPPPLAEAPASTIAQNLAMIWDPANFTDWKSTPRVKQHGKDVARHIPAGAITI